MEKVTENKIQQDQSRAMANNTAQHKETSDATLAFIDNRPEAAMQLRMAEMINNSPQAKQAAQFQAMADNHAAQRQPIQKKENNTGLPDNLKTGMESLSGMSLDDVKVHRNSDKPAQLNAHAYAQGTNIHLASGQEKHLPHELGHVVQQKQGRVKSTTSVGGMSVNDNAGLESEATVMGGEALSFGQRVVQRVEGEVGIREGSVPDYSRNLSSTANCDIQKQKQSSSQNRVQSEPISQLFGQILADGNAPIQTVSDSLISNIGPNKTVIQRNINSTDFEKTNDENADYIVNPDSRGTLYSVTVAAAPAPPELYTKSDDHDDAGDGRDVYAWVPNVRFYDNDEKLAFVEGGQEARDAAVAAFKLIVENQVDDEAIQNPRIGIMGKNDCGVFATALYNAISRSKFRRDRGVGDLVEDITQYTEDYPEMEVGDMMKHIFETQEGVEAACGWHGATVVAKQGGVLVTLEAHVSKSLQAPEFHVREGSGGFVEDNNEKVDYGNRLEVTKYQGGEAPEEDLDRYERLDISPLVSIGENASTEDLNLYHEVIHRDINLLLTQANCVQFWNRQTIMKKSMPAGIVTMRGLLGEDVNEAVAVGARKGGGGKPFKRSANTHYFYQLMHRYRQFCQTPTTAADLKAIYFTISRFPVR